MVLPDSDGIPRAPPYSGTVRERRQISLTGLSPSLVGLSRRLQLSASFVTPWSIFRCSSTALQPHTCNAGRLTHAWFRLIRVRSPLLAEYRLISIPGGTEMFHFPPFASLSLCIQPRIRGHYSTWVSPFGNPRIDACLQLPEAFRSLPRPSSPLGAKASTECPY